MTVENMNLPYDTTLNAAVHSLATHIFPTGYDVIATATTFKPTEGRVAVPREDHPETSLFADAEIEQDFRALIAWGSKHPTTKAGHDHEGVCFVELGDATKRIGEELAKLYDKDQAEKWERELTVYLLSNLAFDAMHPEVNGWNRRKVFDAAMTSEKMKALSTDEVRQATVGFIMHTLAKQQVPIIEVESEEELQEVLGVIRARRERNRMPTDNSGRQNAPTTGSLN